MAESTYLRDKLRELRAENRRLIRERRLARFNAIAECIETCERRALNTEPQGAAAIELVIQQLRMLATLDANGEL